VGHVSVCLSACQSAGLVSGGSADVGNCDAARSQAAGRPGKGGPAAVAGLSILPWGTAVPTAAVGATRRSPRGQREKGAQELTSWDKRREADLKVRSELRGPRVPNPSPWKSAGCTDKQGRIDRPEGVLPRGWGIVMELGGAWIPSRALVSIHYCKKYDVLGPSLHAEYDNWTSVSRPRATCQGRQTWRCARRGRDGAWSVWLQSMTIGVKLRHLCDTYGLPHHGLKKDIIERILEYERRTIRGNALD
jgi:hypothetical protein